MNSQQIYKSFIPKYQRGPVEKIVYNVAEQVTFALGKLMKLKCTFKKSLNKPVNDDNK